MLKHPAIELQGVSFSYDTVPVLEEVNLTVNEGEFLSIVGPNAGGKTTLLKLVLGILKPTKGKVSVFGQAPVRARSRIGYMPQYTSVDPLFPVSVMDVVLMGRLGIRKLFGYYRKHDKKAAEKALEEVELTEISDRAFAALSGGQRQRVLVARALVSEPELLILDEPTSNVDMAVETELYELLRRLNESMTVVLVTHDLGFVSRYIKSVACVNRRVVSHPTCDIKGEMIEQIYGHDLRMIRHDHSYTDKGH